MTLEYIIDPFSMKKHPLIYGMTLVYIIGPFLSQKFP